MGIILRSRALLRGQHRLIYSVIAHCPARNKCRYRILILDAESRGPRGKRAPVAEPSVTARRSGRVSLVFRVCLMSLILTSLCGKQVEAPGPLEVALASLVLITFGPGADLLKPPDSQCASPPGDFPQIAIDNRPPLLPTVRSVQSISALSHVSMTLIDIIPQRDKPRPIPQSSLPRHISPPLSYLARHLFCNSARIAKALGINANPEVPMEWRHRRGTPKSGSIIKSALEKVVKLRIQSNGLRTAAVTKSA